jgi:hypothetical protein
MSNSFDIIYSLRKRNLLVQGGKRKKPASGYSDILLTSSRGLDTVLSIPRSLSQRPKLQEWFKFNDTTYVSPGPIVKDLAGNFYMGNIFGIRISKLDVNGNLLEQYYPPDGTVTSYSAGGWPWGLALIGTNLYAADMLKQFIYKIDISVSPPTFTNIIGSASGISGFTTGLVGTSSLIYGPMNMLPAGTTGLYIMQADNHVVSLYNLSTTILTNVAGGGGSNQQGYLDGTGTAAMFNNPQGLFFDLSGNIIVTDGGNSRIRKITLPSMVVSTIAGSGQVGSLDGPALLATFDFPRTGCCNTSNGDFYIVDGEHIIRKISNGVVSTFLGISDGLTDVTNISCFDNVLYISDQSNPFVTYKYVL